MAEYTYTLTGTIYVPDDWKPNNTHTGFIMPDGRQFKLWEQAEIADDENDVYTNLTFDEVTEMDVFWDGGMCEFEEAS